MGFCGYDPGGTDPRGTYGKSQAVGQKTQQQGWILYRGCDLDHHFPDRCHAAVYGRGIPFLLECPV